ncbi:MAG: type II CAAX endopeptidase family protein [Verrucomicrobiales bacterium]
MAQTLLFDLAVFLILALGVGTFAFALVRRASPLIGWHGHGNVWTGPFRRLDLALVFLYLGLHLAILVAAAQEPPASGGAAQSGGGPWGALLLERALPGAALVFYLGIARSIDVREAFGLERLRLGQIVVWGIGAAAVLVPLARGAAWLFNRAFPGWEPPAPAVALPGSLLVLAMPLFEEVLFRGVLYAVVKRFSDRYFAAILSAGAFALAHYDVGALAPLFALGIGLALAYELSGCLWVPIAAHAAFNAWGLIRAAA